MNILIPYVLFPLMKWNYSVDQKLPIQKYDPILWESDLNSMFMKFVIM